MLSIPVLFTTRQWMRAAKAWRCYLELPQDSIVAAQLTAYIESTMDVTLVARDGSTVKICPAFIVDVPNKGKKFSLVIETCKDSQAEIGPYITGMIGDSILVKIQRLQEQETTPEPPKGDISLRVLQGLHTAWFKNQKFWDFLRTKTTGVTINNEYDCKNVFKALMQVDSCKDLSQAAFEDLLGEFNGYINQR